MKPLDKSLEFYEKFQQFDWDDDTGWNPNNNATVATAEKCIDEIISVLKETVYYKQETYNYWLNVKTEIQRLYKD